MLDSHCSPDLPGDERKKIMADYKITVPADAWKALQAVKAKISALEREKKAMESTLDFPKGEALAIAFSLTPDDKGEFLICDGNGATIGKGTVYFHSGATIPPGWRTRIS